MNLTRSKTSTRGFASMDKEKQKAIASLGGKTVSSIPGHMAAIGRKGGESSGKSRKRK